MPRVQGKQHASPAQRDQIAQDLHCADEADWEEQFAQEEDEEAQAEAEKELGSFDDGMGDLNSYAFLAYLHTKGRLFIVEVNAKTLQGVMAGQGRGTQCIHAAVTHLPVGVDPGKVETVDLHQKRDNLEAGHLYTARGFWEEEQGKEQIYQVDDPAAWVYRRRDYKELLQDIAAHPKVVSPSPAPEWQYFSSRRDLETNSPNYWEIVKSMTKRFHEGEGVR